jgi:DNA gyrase inhibitor GyrI
MEAFYDVCIVVKENFCIPDDSVQEDCLPGGRYAVFTFGHTAEAIKEAWGAVFPELAARGCIADFARPILERYVPLMVEKHLCEICVPIYAPFANRTAANNDLASSATRE